MRDFLDKRRRRKLYNQWVNTSGLPAEEIPPDLKDPVNVEDEIEMEDEPVQGRRYKNNASITVQWRHVVYIVLIIVVLVIVTSILATILAMKSC